MGGNESYLRARDVVSALNRLRNPRARRRGKEKKKHFAQDRQTALSFWNDHNILGYGVGPKVPGDKKSDFSLIFFVRNRLAENRLRGMVPIPKQLMIRTLGMRVQTDVQEWGRPAVAHGALVPGASVGDSRGHKGTITLAVRDNATNDPLILSCSHVLAQCGEDAHEGDEVESPVDPMSPIGPNVVGALSSFTIIDRHGDNEVDAAVAGPANGATLSNNIPGVGKITAIRDLTQEDADSLKGMRVLKVGASTGRRTGSIRNFHIATSIVYHEMQGDPAVNFVELVEYDCDSEEGDSGAPVLDAQNPANIVGMHIAGKADGTGLFTHIQLVFECLSIGL